MAGCVVTVSSKLSVVLTHSAVAELLQDTSPACCTHSLAEGRVSVQLQHGCSDGIRASRGHQVALDSVGHSLWDCINSTAYHWPLESHGFTDHQWQDLVQGWDQNDICSHVELQDGCLDVHDSDLRLSTLLFCQLLPPPAGDTMGRRHLKDLVDVPNLMIPDVPSADDQLLEIRAPILLDESGASLGFYVTREKKVYTFIS